MPTHKERSWLALLVFASPEATQPGCQLVAECEPFTIKHIMIYDGREMKAGVFPYYSADFQQEHLRNMLLIKFADGTNWIKP